MRLSRRPPRPVPAERPASDQLHPVVLHNAPGRCMPDTLTTRRTFTRNELSLIWLCFTPLTDSSRIPGPIPLSLTLNLTVSKKIEIYVVYCDFLTNRLRYRALRCVSLQFLHSLLYRRPLLLWFGRLSVRPSVGLDVTLLYCVKTTQARITKSLPSAPWKTLLLGFLRFSRSTKGVNFDRCC